MGKTIVEKKGERMKISKLPGMNEKILRDAGYNQIGSDRWQYKAIDENGIKYYICCTKYQVHYITMWEFSSQITHEVTGATVNVTLVQWFNYVNGKYDGKLSLKDVHDYYDSTWYDNGAIYYQPHP